MQDSTTLNKGNNRLLTEKEVAAFLNLSCSWLQHKRLSGGSIPYIKCGRAIRYRLDEVRAYIEKNTRVSTSQSKGDKNDK